MTKQNFNSGVVVFTSQSSAFWLFQGPDGDAGKPGSSGLPGLPGNDVSKM